MFTSPRIGGAQEPVVLYQNNELTIFDDAAGSGNSKYLSVVHRVGKDKEMFEVIGTKIIDPNGNEVIEYSYAPSVLEDFMTQLGPLFDDNPPSYVYMYHFLDQHELPGIPGMSLPTIPTTGKGRPIALVIIKNEPSETDTNKSYRTNKGKQPAAKWKLSDSTSAYDNYVIGYRYLNTYNKAATYKSDQQLALQANQDRRQNAINIAKARNYTSKNAEAFGYKNAIHIHTHDNVEYFSIDSK